MKRNNSTFVGLILIVTLSLAWKMCLVIMERVPFNADEAIVALMARHILQGQWSPFFYGQSYMGSLDAMLVALGFALFGQSVWVIRLVQSLLYAGFLISTFWLGKAAFQSEKVGLVASALLAIPTVNMTLYTTASLGGYGEALLFGNILLILAIKIAQEPKNGWAVLWGVVAGLGLWANGLTLVYAFPAFVYMLWQISRVRNPLLGGKTAVLIVMGGAIGALPWWFYASSNRSSQLIMELLGSAVSVEEVAWLERSGMHLVNFILLGIPVTLGLRPPWSVQWLALPLIPIVLLAWGLVLVAISRNWKQDVNQRGQNALLLGVILTLIGGFLFTAFGIDPSGRYFLPLSVPLALFAAVYVCNEKLRSWLRYGVLAALAMYQVAGNIQAAVPSSPGLTTQFHAPTIVDHRYDSELIHFLLENGELRGYSNYWVSYPLAFLSEEKLVFTPELPYHLDLRYTTRDNRYAPYDDFLSASDRVAYITTRNDLLNHKITTGFERLGVTWSEKVIGDYHIFYQLSRVVRPGELGLGENTK